MEQDTLKLLKIDLGVIRDILIENRMYHIHKNKIMKSKKKYTRKNKHKKTSDE